MALAQLAIELSANVSKFNSEIGKANKALAGFQNAFSMLGRTLASLGLGYSLGRVFTGFIQAAGEAEEIEKRLRFAMEMHGYAWDNAKTHVDEFANAIAKTTRFSDEEARQALTNLLLYTNDYAKAQEGAQLAMDMSVRTGMDLQTTSRYLGMAMAGNVEMLGRYIPQLRGLDDILGKNATAAEKAAYGMEIIRKMFSGTAAAEAGTYAKAIKDLTKAWDDLSEAIGNHILPAVTELFTELTKVIKAWESFFGMGDPTAKRISVLKTQLKFLDDLYIKEQSLLESGKLRGAQEFLTQERINNIYEQRIPILEELDLLEKKMVDKKKPITAPTPSPTATTADPDAWKKLIPELTKAYEQHYKEISDMQEAYEKNIEDGIKLEKDKYDSLVKESKAYEDEMSQFNQNLLAIGQRRIEEEIRIEQEKYDEFLKLANQNEEDVKNLNEALLKNQERIIDAEIKAAEESGKAMDGFAQNIASAFQSGFMDLFKRGIKDLGDAFNQFCNNLIESFARAISQMITNYLLFGDIVGGKGGTSFFGTSKGGFGGLIGGLFGAIGLQHGGIVTKPTMAMIGEAGPEAIIPLKNGKAPGGEGNTIIVNNINALDPQSWSDFVRRNPAPLLREFNKSARSLGSAKDTMKRFG